MSGQPTTTANPQTTWGDNSASNQYHPKGDGLQPQWTQVDVKTGEISVYRHTRAPGFPLGDGGSVDTKIGTIKPGGTFEVRSRDDGTPYATGKEIVYYGDTKNRNATITQAQRVATRSWDGKTQPSPSNSIHRNGVASPNPTEYSSTSTTDTKGTTEQSSDEGKSKPKPLDPNWKLKRKTENTGGASKGEVMVYPVGLRQSQQDFIKFQMMRYAPKQFGVFNEGSNMSGIGERPKNREILSSTILPVPGGINDNNGVGWGQETMDPVKTALSSIALSTIMGGLGAGGQKIHDIATSAVSNSDEVTKGLGTAIAASASKTGSQLLKRTQGAILNPNMELLFDSPSLRQFNFTWKLAPRDPDEAQAVVKIIRWFKQGMAAIREEPNLFLRTPNTFQLSYHHNGNAHNYLNKFKECALTNCGVQYTPDGNYATYEDGVMAAYQVTLAFQELEPIFADDYDATGPIKGNPVFSTGANIGY